MRTAHMVMCAGCSGLFGAVHPPRSSDWFCVRCTKRITGEFRMAVGGQVVLLDDPFPSRYVIRAIDGDMFTLRRLGFPDDSSISVHRGLIDPLRSPVSVADPSRGDSPRLPKEIPVPVPAETPAALLSRAADKLRDPDAEVPAAALAELADWLEECAERVSSLVLPYTFWRAFKAAQAIVGEDDADPVAPAPA